MRVQEGAFRFRLRRRCRIFIVAISIVIVVMPLIQTTRMVIVMQDAGMVMRVLAMRIDVEMDPPCRNQHQGDRQRDRQRVSSGTA